MQRITAILRLVRWFCKQVNFDELLIAVTIFLEIIQGKRTTIPLRSDRNEKYPNYRQYGVDPVAPLTEQQAKSVQAKADFQQLLTQYRDETGKELTPIYRHKRSFLPPSHIRCEHCNAPASYLYVNDGRKNSQLRCKVCNTLFQSNRIRTDIKTRYWCPYCGRALYRWKSTACYTIYKCGNKRCPCFLKNLEKLNQQEKNLRKTSLKSQFKVFYQYREYHFTPAQIRTVQPSQSRCSLNTIHHSFHTLGLVLAYSVSYGISSRMPRHILRNIHGIAISHQTVLNYQNLAAVLAFNFIQKFQGPLTDSQIIGDETYIRICDEWGYAWFIIGAQSKAIWAFNISDNRDVLPALACVSKAMEKVKEHIPAIDCVADGNPSQKHIPSIDFIADGNPSYDAAVLSFNAKHANKSIKRFTVIGLSNDDPESKQYRPLKQIIERLNRTYKFHTRARCGFKTLNGAITLTTLFVAYYNFLRPHTSLDSNPPINIPSLADISTIQGKWLKILHLAA